MIMTKVAAAAAAAAAAAVSAVAAAVLYPWGYAIIRAMLYP